MKTYKETIELMNKNFELFIEIHGEKWIKARLFNDATDEQYSVSIETCERLQGEGLITTTHGAHESENYDYVQGYMLK